MICCCSTRHGKTKDDVTHVAATDLPQDSLKFLWRSGCRSKKLFKNPQMVLVPMEKKVCAHIKVLQWSFLLHLHWSLPQNLKKGGSFGDRPLHFKHFINVPHASDCGYGEKWIQMIVGGCKVLCVIEENNKIRKSNECRAWLMWKSMGLESLWTK